MRILTIGETTYDISFRDGQPTSACSGGSAYNSAISLGRCGLPVSLISTFGKDHIGDLSYAFLETNGVNCDLIKRFTGQSRVALAFFNSDNNANYSFYAASSDVAPDYPDPQKNDIILLGSSFALRDNGRDQLLEFLSNAKKAGSITIYDPNARQSVIGNPAIIHKILENISLSTIVKGSDEDFRNIFGITNGKNVYSHISEEGNPILVYTKGPDGAELLTPDLHLIVSALKTHVVSTIGAGDNFSAGIVYGLFHQLKGNLILNDLQTNNWEDIMDYASMFASAVCESAENYLPAEMGKTLRNDSI